MTTIRSHTFDVALTAEPHQVWKALTSPWLTSHLYFGMAAESSWEPGSAVVLEASGLPASSVAGALAGEVLRAVPDERLSFTLAAGPGQPETYVTWVIAPVPDGSGSRVRLVVDELGAAAGGDEEAEEAWAAVLSGLHVALSGLPLR